MQTWLITGCSSGLGRSLAEAVLRHGDRAIVTGLDLPSVADLQESYPHSALAVALDVRDAAGIAHVVALGERRFGAIDVLVNNAGYGYRAAIEEGEPEQVSELFATMFFGPVALIQAVLPGMRARRRGTIVTMSSIGARVAAPGSGYYGAVKSAMEGMSAGLSTEVAPLGIRVLVIEPGGFRTGFAGSALRESQTPIDDYAPTAGRRRKDSSGSGTQPGDPAKAAAAIITAVESATPPFRLVLGPDAVAMAERELQLQLAELDQWRELSSGTDFSEP